MSGAALARLAVEKYVQFYTASPPAAGDVTKVALDLGKVDAIGAAARTLADALTQDMAKHTAVIWKVQRDTQTRERRAETKTKQVRLSSLGSRIAGGRHRREPQRI